MGPIYILFTAGVYASITVKDHTPKTKTFLSLQETKLYPRLM